MTINSILKKLGRFGYMTTDKNTYVFWTRNPEFKNRYVKVVDQNGRAVALPLFVDKDGNETVVFHAKTVKSLVQFLEGA